MRQLTRERDQIVEERTMAKNPLHAEETEAFPPPEGDTKRFSPLWCFIQYFNKN